MERSRVETGLLHFVCDYAPGDLAISEVIQVLSREVPDNWRIHTTSVESFNTLETGFVVAQLALQEESRRPTRTALYVNTAPRQDRRDPRRNNEGEQLVYVKLRNGVEIVVVNSGYSLSFVREEITELRTVLIDLGGSQFRSRDNFPEVIGRMVRQDDFEKILGDELSPSGVIPHFEPDVIAYRDSFGNLKTGLRSSNERLKRLSPGQRVEIEMNGVRRTATVATGSFNVQEGDLAFAPGSSGYADRFWEIFQRGGSASLIFGNPRVGARIDWKLVSEG